MMDGFAPAANTGAADASAVPVARNCLRFILTVFISRGRSCAEPALSRSKDLHGLLEMRGLKVRPHHRQKDELGVSALPEQEVAQPLFASGSNQEVDIRRRQCCRDRSAARI